MPTLAEIKDKYPEVYQAIYDEGRKAGKDAGAEDSYNEGHKAGLEKGLAEGTEKGMQDERARVVDILSADADFAVSKKAIEDGVSADGAYKLFFEAEKDKRAKGLKDLENAAPDSLGQETNDDLPETRDKRPADQILAEKASTLAKEKGIDLAEAQKQVFAENPDLVAKWGPMAQA